MPRTFPIKQGRAANLRPKGRRSKRGGASSRLPHIAARACCDHPQSQSVPTRSTHEPPITLIRDAPAPKPSPTQKRERVKTRSLPKTIGHPMIDKDPQMMR